MTFHDALDSFAGHNSTSKLYIETQWTKIIEIQGLTILAKYTVQASMHVV